jgi:hypothetical protein
VLGRFLEYSLATPDIRASFEFYLSLGFAALDSGESYPYPYAAVTDGRLCLGLHQSELAAPALTFVKPDLLKALDALARLKIEFEHRRLGNDVFNEAAWRDPGEHLVRLIEARTFSPAKPARDAALLCGYFVEIALPQPELETAKEYWEALGFVGMDEFDDALPHVSLTSDFIDLGLYEPALLRRPLLRFEVEDIAATRAALEHAGIRLSPALPPGLTRGTALQLNSPEGTGILIVAVT